MLLHPLIGHELGHAGPLHGQLVHLPVKLVTMAVVGLVLIEGGDHHKLHHPVVCHKLDGVSSRPVKSAHVWGALAPLV